MLLGADLTSGLARRRINNLLVEVHNLNVARLGTQAENWPRVLDAASNANACNIVISPEGEALIKLHLGAILFNLVHLDLPINETDGKNAELLVVSCTQSIHFLKCILLRHLVVILMSLFLEERHLALGSTIGLL